jgi:predicted enzyme related to lactoylglutathione lyase
LCRSIAVRRPGARPADVTVDDVDATPAKAESLGGKTVMPPMDVPGVGRVAVPQDPQGAVLCVIKYASA